MSDFQTVKRRGHSQSANSKYPEQHQQLVEMGFDTTSVSRTLDSNNGDMEAATAVLIGEERSKQDAEEKVVHASKEKKPATSTLAAAVGATPAAIEAKGKGAARQSASLASVSGPAVKEIKDTHQKMMATYKVQKCKETGAHDRKMCMHYHSLSDRRRNPFEILYSCYECPNTVDGGECPDGDSCMHSHTMLERMFHPELYKISVCQRQLTGNKCDRAMLCAFAHNDADLRISPSHLTTKYAMQEEAKSTPVPVSHSPMLDHIRNNLVKLVREHGSEGIIAADLPKYYQGKFHESLDIIDESGKKYKLKDLIGPHNNIHVVLTGQPKFVSGDPSTASLVPENSASNVNTNSGTVPANKDSSVSNTAPALSVKDRVVELIKAAGTEGILATDMPKKYQDRYGEKLEKDWTMGLSIVAGMVLTQTKQYTKYTFNPITAGIKDTAIPAATTKEGKSPVSASTLVTSTASKAGTAVVSTPSATTSSIPAASSGSKWGSSAGKSFASILASASSNNSAPVVAAPTSVSDTTNEPSTPSRNGGSTSTTVEPAVTAPVSFTDLKTSNQKPVKSEKIVPSSKATVAVASSKTDSKSTSNPTEPIVAVSDKESSRHSSATLKSIGSNESVLGMNLLQNPASPSSASVGLTIGSSPSSRSDVNGSNGLPKPLFGLNSQLGVTGLDHDQFSLSGVTGLGGNGSSLLDLTGSSLSGILPSSFDLPLVDNVDLNSSSVLPPGLSKTIGKPNASSSVSSAPSLSSIIGTSLGASAGLVGLPLSSNSANTPERNVSNGTVISNAGANISNMTQNERIAYLERELFAKTQETESLAVDISTLRSRVSELESAQMAQDDRLRSSILEKDIELLTKHQEIAKFEEDFRKMKEEKLVDLDQYFIYFSKIEEVINGMKCKEEVFSDKVKPDDVQELFQFKKLIRNYVANVKVQLKNKFDAVVAQSHIVRTSSGASVGKDLSVEAVALGMTLPAGPPPGGLTSSSTSITGSSTMMNNSSSPSTSTSVFGMLSSGTGASSAPGSASSISGTSRFTTSFDNHALPFHNSHHSVLGNVVDAFASSSVLFPSSSSDLTGSSSSSSVLSSAKQCGLPGCFKEGLYTCAGCRKISYCGEAHQRSHWAQHSQNCYQR
jgi:hypothetical protein